VTRPSENEAKVTFERGRGALERDFVLNYTLGDKDVGLSMAAYRPDAEKPGYFMMLVSPKSKLQESEIIKRDFVFVMDTSHSMDGAKIEQAKEALRYCVKNLNE